MNTSQTELRPGRLDARLLLSYGQKSRSIPRSIHTLVVGAANGAELILQAELQRDVVFLAVDTDAATLSTARRSAREKGLENIEFDQVDFQSDWTAELDVPFGGFDTIQVTALPRGVQDLTTFLTALQNVMAAHTAVSIDLLASKQHTNKVATALAELHQSGESTGSIDARLEEARAFIDRMVGLEPDCVDWRRASLVSDSDFIERYLQATSATVDVAELFSALDATGMRFLRWHDNVLWNFENLNLSREELERVRSLPLAEQFRIVEEQRSPACLELVIGGAENAPRERFDLTKAGETHFMVNPGLVFSVETRNLWGVTEYDRLTVRRAGEDPVEVKPSPAQTALFALRDQREPFSGLNLVEVMTAEGASLEEALLALHQLVGMELLYRPHDHDVAQYFSTLMQAKPTPETSDVVVTPSIPQKNSFVPAAGEPAAPLPVADVSEPSMTNRVEGGRDA